MIVRHLLVVIVLVGKCHAEMRIICAKSCSALPADSILGGCSVHPLPDRVTRQSTLGIVTAIRCEAQQAIFEHAPDPAFNKGAIGYIFNFDILEHNQAGMDLSFKQPFISGGEFDLTLTGAKADLLRRADRRFTIVDTFEELKRADCSDELLRSRFKYPIAGSIGLNEVIATFIGIDRTRGSKARAGRLHAS